ncbi:sensor histidine kinase [Cryptosporangium aurantiacum]|uniref:histidine kinase n=1 Tax=Cryptosporangium aurantiacum TaxID=134849 RepID=A0A1M7RBM3_9ACTN|nr:histidine kinase [Cryptosporangium aurantiacum]SHN43715.1 Signal transduction histidine kinase [Cryptosporangium aurantiacum]
MRRVVLIDITLGVLTATAVAIAIAADLGDHRRPGVLAYGIAVALGVVLLVRRRFPRLVLLVSAFLLIAYYVRDYPPIGLPVPIGAALFSAAEAGRTGWAATVTAALLGISTVARLIDDEDAAYLFGYELLVTATAMAATIALGDGLRSRRLLRAEQRERSQREREAHERQLAGAIQAERLEVARDVHDAVGHTLTVVSLHTDVALEAVDEDPAAARRALEHVRTACDAASAELRRTLGLIRIADAPGLRALPALATDLGPGITLDVPDDLGPLPPVVDAAVFRIVQEAVTNARRHAGAVPVTVRLRPVGDEVEVEVRDEGPPTNGTPDGAGLGLVGLTERVALLGGRTEIGPHPGGGYRVWAMIPTTAVAPR